MSHPNISQNNNMSSPTDIPQTQAANNDIISGSPSHHKFLIPSPVPTRRNRTFSASERAQAGPTIKGKVKNFCRQKGHGFITPEDSTKPPVFVHISDIEGEYVPKEGDDVTYKLCPLPFNPEKKQAVHVKITHLAPGVSHETWNAERDPTLSPRH